MPADSGAPGPNPFAELVGLETQACRSGYSRLALAVSSKHLNLNGVVHGAVLYALADTGMGTALYPTLEVGQICATIEIKINYFKPVFGGPLICETELVHRGRSIAHLASRIFRDGLLMASADGNYAMFRPRHRIAPAADAPPAPSTQAR